MKQEIICTTCQVETIVIENKLFFAEEKKALNIICPACSHKIKSEYTDGWFFIQTKEQYHIELKIEEQKKKLKYVMGNEFDL